MDNQQAVSVLESLSSDLRLQVFRLLVKQGSKGMVAGEISTRLGVPPNNLSFHFKALTNAGLLTVEQEGRYQRYRADISLMLDLIGYLTDECCNEQAEQCAIEGRPADCALSSPPDQARAGRNPRSD